MDKILILFLLLAGFSPAGWGAEPAAAAVAAISQKTCPVMPNHKIKKNFYGDYQGRRIFFCCGSCVKSFKKNPARYLENLPKEILKAPPVSHKS